MKHTTRFTIALLLIVAVTACSTTSSVQPEANLGQAAMVVSGDGHASSIGRDVLLQGGNAVDAAVACGFALAVTYPQAGNIGGGGFMVIRNSDGSATTFDFREMAPAASHAKMFLDEEGEYSSDIHHISHLSVGVPGTVAGLYEAHKKLGRLPWATLVAPAVQLAESGFPVTKRLSDSLKKALDDQMKPHAQSQAVFTNNGTPFEPGDVLRQPDLAKSLARIRDLGRDGFYRGETASLIAEEMKAKGGIITEDDLANYRVVERKPVRGTYRGFDIIGMPLPSSGGTAIVQALNILEGFDLKSRGQNSAAYVHLVAEAMRMAFRDRAQHMGDEDFVSPPLARLQSKAYARTLQPRITLTRAGKSAPSDLAQAHESDETTHYSVVDADGMGVAVTYTLENSYGSGIVVPGAGFLLNNEMGDFNGKAGMTTEKGHIGTPANLAAPGKRMLSSMSPTIIGKNGKLVAVIGSPGGRTIINTVLLVALNVMEFGMDIEEAVLAPRFHHQWLPDRILLEAQGQLLDTREALEAMGHKIETRKKQGHAHCIGINQKTGLVHGAADRRDVDSQASGY